jgi:hypothetical protein
LGSAFNRPFSSDGCFRPSSIQEICSIVKWAKSINKKVRVAGSRHSTVGSYWTADPDDENTVRILLDRFRSINIEGNEVTVDAGCNLGVDPNNPSSTVENSLVYNLQNAGLALANLGGITHQTVGGFLSTGSQGGSTSRELVITKMVIVNGMGVEQTFRPGDEGFNHVCVSMGLCGVIAQVSLECVPCFVVRYRTETIPYSKVLHEREHHVLPKVNVDDVVGWQRLVQEYPYSRYLWFPQKGVDRIQLWEGVVKENGFGDLFKNKPVIQGYGETPLFLQMILKVFYKIVYKVPPLNCLVTWIITTVIKIAEPLTNKPTTAHGWWGDVLPMDNEVADNLFPVIFTELWFDLDKANNVMGILEDYFKEDKGLSHTGPLAFEFYAAKKSDFIMSMAYGAHQFRVDVFWPGEACGNPDDFFKQFWKLFEEKDLKFRCHWGKAQYTYHMTNPADKQGYLRSVYPQFDCWLKFRREQDRDNIFLTPYWARVLGEEAQEPEAEEDNGHSTFTPSDVLLSQRD